MIGPIGAAGVLPAEIGGIGDLGNSAGIKGALKGKLGDDSFAGMLEQAINKVDGLHKNADLALKDLASGQSVDLHGTMIALEQADIALRATVAVRDKLVGAYEHIMQMPV